MYIIGFKKSSEIPTVPPIGSTVFYLDTTKAPENNKLFDKVSNTYNCDIYDETVSDVITLSNDVKYCNRSTLKFTLPDLQGRECLFDFEYDNEIFVPAQGLKYLVLAGLQTDTYIQICSGPLTQWNPNNTKFIIQNGIFKHDTNINVALDFNNQFHTFGFIDTDTYCAVYYNNNKVYEKIKETDYPFSNNSVFNIGGWYSTPSFYICEMFYDNIAGTKYETQVYDTLEINTPYM